MDLRYNELAHKLRLFNEIAADVRRWGVAGRAEKKKILRPNDEILISCIWVCATRSGWHELPRNEVNPKTANRHFKQWNRGVTWDHVLWAIAREFQKEYGIPLLDHFEKRILRRPVLMRDLVHWGHIGKLPGSLEEKDWVLMLFMNPSGPPRRNRLVLNVAVPDIAESFRQD